MQICRVMNKVLTILILFLIVTGNVISQTVKNPEQGSIVSEPVTVTYKKKSPSDNPTTANNQNNSNNTGTKVTQAKNLSVKENVKSESWDTIIKLGGKKIPCNVCKVNPTSVSYNNPGQNKVIELPRKEIEKIYYKTGRREVYNKPVLQMIDKTQWEAVLVTENPNEVDGLFKRGVVKANASSGSRSPKAAKTSATIRLQKKAANMGALIVLVTNSEMKGGYGEIPGWELEGIAYGDTPPADTASVNKAIRQLMARNKARIENAKKNKK